MPETNYGKMVKKRLIDIEKTQTWLFQQVTAKTGLYVDSSYFARICNGKAGGAKIKQAINEILELES